MKKILLSAAALLTAAAASAAWGNSAADAIPVFPEGTNTYATELKTTPDGGVWAMIYHPNLKDAKDEYDTGNVVYEYRVQYWDKQGNPKFPAEGMLVSDFKNKSYTVVNNYLSCDEKGNLLLCVLDRRNSSGSGESYTAYLISPEGEMLWGDEGTPISDELKPAGQAAMMSAVPLGDGTFVFSWIEAGANGQNVMLQRLDKDGKRLWDSSKVSLLDDQCSNPSLIPSDDNTCILVYSRTSSQIIYARKLDFEGSNVWGKDTRIYRGGWAPIPLHTLLSVVPSGNGGALVSWNDDRANTNIENAFLSYVTSDGKLGFAGASTEGDVKLDYEGWRCFNVKAVPAADGSCFYAMWRTTSSSQSMQGMKVQKVSLDGELLWGDEGKVCVPFEQHSVGYNSVQAAGENGVVAFYEIYRSYFDQQAFACRFDKDGNKVWKDGEIALSEPNRKATSLESMTIGKDSWLYTWEDAPGEEDAVETQMMGVLNLDGTFGVKESGIAATLADGGSIRFDGNTLYASGNSAKVYNVSGALAAEAQLVDGKMAINLPAGVYVVKTDNNETIKIIK